MIKIKFIVLASVIFLLTIFVESSMADCPAGYTQKTVQIPIYEEVNGVMVSDIFTVTLCYKCSITGLGGVESYKMIKWECTGAIPADIAFNAIANTLSNPIWIDNNLCAINPSTPPCNEGVTYGALYESYRCWFAKRVLNSMGQEVVEYKPCHEESVCEVTYSWCYNRETKQYELKAKESANSNNWLEAPCSDLEAGDVQIPTTLGEETGCFEIYTYCKEL